MAKVGIVMGSDSDMPVMSKAADILAELGIDFEMTIISAHREPEEFFQYAKSAEEKGYKVIIAGAGNIFTNAARFIMLNGSSVYLNNYQRTNAYSVRCIRATALDPETSQMR